MEITLEEFIEVCLIHGVQLPDQVLAGIYKEIKKREKTKASGNNLFIAAYCEEWKAKYGTNPPMIGKQLGAVKRLVKALGVARASELVRTYLQLKDPWIVKNRHDLVTFEAKLNMVVIAHDTGQVMSQKTIHDEDRLMGDRQEWDALKRRRDGVRSID